MAKKFFSCIICLIVVLFQGFRSFNVGTDLISYLPSYSKIGYYVTDFHNLTFLNYEPGYVLYNKLLFDFGVTERGFLIVTASIIQIPIFYMIYKNSKKILLSIFVYFAFSNFIITFSGLRQAIAMGICFFAYKFIKEKKIIFYIITIFFASTFHASAWFCLIIYPVYYLKLNKKNFLWTICILFIIFVFKSQIVQISNYLYYGETRELVNTNAFTMFFMYTILLCISFYFNSNDSDFIGLRNILLIICYIYALASVSNVFIRLSFPLSLYLTILIPDIVEKINIKPSNMLKEFICFTICIACFFYFIGDLNTLPFSFM
ncbi:EpsG family protein [Absiella sp. AM29-15]|uniref:EpsG family protein n=1 Tax=Absiella sp. AM29-15 TaxID=2292278 RepID=UPI001F3459B6|nr:EpsG family protein [Absiella sp. AM29-15]